MWNSIHKFGLSDEEIDQIAKELLEKELNQPMRPCHDCGAEVNQKHLRGCDVARCLTCGGQRLSCDCKGDKGHGDIWTGVWPGTIEALEQKLICCWEDTKEWMADLNTLAYNKAMKR